MGEILVKYDPCCIRVYIWTAVFIVITLALIKKCQVQQDPDDSQSFESSCTVLITPQDDTTVQPTSCKSAWLTVCVFVFSYQWFEQLHPTALPETGLPVTGKFNLCLCIIIVIISSSSSSSYMFMICFYSVVTADIGWSCRIWETCSKTMV